MASYICIKCKQFAFMFEPSMSVDRTDEEMFDGHEFYAIATKNIIEGVEAK